MQTTNKANSCHWPARGWSLNCVPIPSKDPSLWKMTNLQPTSLWPFGWFMEHFAVASLLASPGSKANTNHIFPLLQLYLAELPVRVGGKFAGRPLFVFDQNTRNGEKICISLGLVKCHDVKLINLHSPTHFHDNTTSLLPQEQKIIQ